MRKPKAKPMVTERAMVKQMVIGIQKQLHTLSQSLGVTVRFLPLYFQNQNKYPIRHSHHQ
jgi:hypothetical protein